MNIPSSIDIEREMQSVKSEKRRPGRPSTKPARPVVEKHGIVESAMDGGSLLEVAYDKPLVIKTLFSYFRNIKSKELYIRCDPAGMTLFCRGRSIPSRVITKIDGNAVNWYYCKSLKWICLNRSSTEAIFSCIDKSFYKLMISLHSDDPEALIIILKDSDLDKECRYKIPLHTDILIADDLLAVESILSGTINFPLSFTLSAQQFKKTVSDLSAADDGEASFYKIRGSKFMIRYSNTGLDYTEVYNSSDKIDLHCDDSFFRFECRFNVKNITSLANSMVSDRIKVHCRQDGDILFESELDNRAITTYTLTTSQKQE